MSEFFLDCSEFVRIYDDFRGVVRVFLCFVVCICGFYNIVVIFRIVCFGFYLGVRISRLRGSEVGFL